VKQYVVWRVGQAEGIGVQATDWRWNGDRLEFMRDGDVVGQFDEEWVAGWIFVGELTNPNAAVGPDEREAVSA